MAVTDRPPHQQSSETAGGGVQAVTAQLSRWIVGGAPEGVPDDVMAQAGVVLTDTVGVMLGASTEAPVNAAIEAFAWSHGQGTVVGRNEHVPADIAALINGIGAHSIELDDSHSPSLTHPASVLIPTALATAEMAAGVSGKDLLEAIIVAYDVQARLSKAMGPRAQFSHGFHPTSVCGTVGASVCAGRLLGLSVEQMQRCIGLAASQSSGLVAFRSDPSGMHKDFQPGVAARNGVHAALLARAGYLAAPDVLGDEFDALTPFAGPDVVRDQLLDQLGERFEICDTTIKRHPSCGRSHAAIDALLAILAEHALRPSDITGIEVSVAHSAVPTVDRRPQLTHNLQYLLAVVTIAGHLERGHFGPAWSQRPDVAELASRVSLTGSDELEDTFPARKGAAVTVRTEDASYGRVLTGPRGDPDQPLTLDEIWDKFEALSRTRLDAERTQSLWTSLARVDQSESVDPLIASLAV